MFSTVYRRCFLGAVLVCAFGCAEERAPISALGNMLVPIADCDQNQEPQCKPVTVNQNHFAYELKSYKSVPDYLWQAGLVYGLFDAPNERGVY